MTITLLYPSAQVEYHQRGAMFPAVPGRRYGIIKCAPWDENWHQANVASAQPVGDRPVGDGKGHQIPVTDSWWTYLEKINSARAMKFWRSVGWLWINAPYIERANAESVLSAFNIVSWDEETASHVRLRSYPWNMDTSKLNPAMDNWHYQPDLFWSALAYDKAGNPNRIGDGIDAYNAHISYTESWMNKKYIETFPTGIAYQFYGSDIWGNGKPLLTFKNGRRVFHNATWRIATPSALPPME